MTNIIDTCLDSIREILQNPEGREYCLSGGAEGADTYWSILAERYAATETLHFSYEGHRKYCKDAVGLRVKVSPERLMLADAALKKAKKGNNRNFPCRSDHVNSLLRRNYYQIIDSNSCYAVSRIIHGVVDGGTSWATQMYVDKHMEYNPMRPCECYIYDTITDQWHQWIYNMWHPIEAYEVPTPKGIWTGIGSRELTENAKTAMEELWLRDWDPVRACRVTQ